MSLIPNGTADRLKYIAKTFGGRPNLVLDMIDVVAQTVGEDRWRFAIRDAAHQDPDFSVDVKHYGVYSLAGLWQPDKEPPPKVFVDAVVAMASELPALRGAHPADPLFPWMAVQLNAAAKEADRRWKRAPSMFSPEVHLVDYRTLLDRFRRRGSAMAQWFVATRPDLTKLDADEAFDSFVAWEEVEGPSTIKGQQGEVVYEFDDGYTVQKLTTEGQLDAEGEAMQHCVGSYCTEVKKGNVEIYSIRDPKGYPHVTIEYDPNSRYVKQIKGKQNDEPAPKYKPYIDTFLETLPKMSAHKQAIFDLLGNESDVDSDEEQRWLTEKWDSFISDADELKEWLDAGVSATRPEFVESLKSENVEPAELISWPMPVIMKLEEQGHDDEALVRLARFYARLGTLERGDTGSSQVPLPLDEPVRKPKDLRPSRHTPGGAHQYPHITLAGVGFTHWDLDNVDDDELERLVEAGKWAENDHWDPADTNGPDNFAPWYVNHFQPDIAQEWNELEWTAPYPTTTADTAAVLRHLGVTPEQVADAIEAKRLKGTDADDPRYIAETVQSMKPNKRRRAH